MMPRIDVDDESAKMEAAEVKARQQAVRDMAPSLALGLRMAWRILMDIPDVHIPEHRINDIKEIENIVTELSNAEGH